MHWPNGRLRIAGYVCADAPPEGYVSSARVIVLRGDEVLAVEDRDGHHHVMPGGRLEEGETPEQAARREVREETGWTVGELRQVGVLHLHGLDPRPPGARYPYPDAFQIVYAADALDYDPGAAIFDEWVKGSGFRRPEELALTAGERAFLEAAYNADAFASTTEEQRADDRQP